jgi:hypothetical protein
MSKPLRYTLALVILAGSLALLAWAFWPGERVIRRQFIQPTEMQLPTPGSLLPMQCEFAWTNQPLEMACPIRVADRFALIL